MILICAIAWLKWKMFYNFPAEMLSKTVISLYYFFFSNRTQYEWNKIFTVIFLSSLFNVYLNGMLVQRDPIMFMLVKWVSVY